MPRGLTRLSLDVFGRSLRPALLLSLGVGAAFAAGGRPPDRGPLHLIDLALTGEPAESTSSIAELREAGPEGLARLLEAREEDDRGASAQDWERVIDGVARQRYATESGLYWYTDVDEALEAAAEADRPVLMLRMLGELDEVYSCANSRYFRTLLYADPAISAELRDNWVVAWTSERPVPKLTVDFGDGRVWQTTVTGNSIHYVLNSYGDVLDALPGLYSPDAFLDGLVAARGLHNAVRDLDDPAPTLSLWHRRELERSADRAARTLGRPASAVAAAYRTPLTPDAVVEAPRVMAMAMSKMMVEQPLARAVVPTTPLSAGSPDALKRGQALGTDAQWAELGRSFPVRLSAPSLALIRAERATGGPEMFASLERTVGRDTAFNELWFHGLLHAWLEQAPDVSWEALNRRVYDTMFATPAADPWLGLWNPEVYDGLPPASR